MIKNRKFLLFLSLITALVLLSAVYALKKDKQNPPENKAVTEISYPFTLTDFLNREVTIKEEPQRIVSLSPATTEILFALGAGSKIVGITAYDDYPPDEVKDLPKVGDYQGPNIEAIVKQNPDLICASTLSGKDHMEALQKNGYNVVVLEADSFERVTTSIKLTAQITNTQKQGDKIINDMQNKIKKINEKVKNLPNVKTFYLVDSNGNWTTGRNTFINELITLGGGENVAGNLSGWVQYSLETLVDKNPSVILTAPHAGDIGELINKPGFEDTEAVQKGKVFVISDDNIISRPSNRIVQGLEEIAKFLHPEAFNQSES